MNTIEFFDDVRKKFFDEVNNDEYEIYKTKLKEIDNFIIKLINNNDNFWFILNNKLSGYLLYLKEKNKINVKIDERIVIHGRIQIERLTNTIEILNSFGKKFDTKFLIIKTLNIIPYFPVNDVDVIIEKPDLLKEFHEHVSEYGRTAEREENKINFFAKKPDKYHKLSFHLDITWDSDKIINLDKNKIWEKSTPIRSHVNLNSPGIEAVIKLQEGLLENLHYKLIDHLFITNFLEKKYSRFVPRTKSQKFPYYVGLVNVTKNINDRNLLTKNIKRYIIWKMYSLLTGKYPLRERCDEVKM